ncbi:SGNH/GDSL hydrolase family protein [Telmatocola sphagniphila]|uniref:SGNH/GDSL hydrolase family protein n=1 Tax=Telmatocola sphagniphila TaxID=1123043 RepID=A0A8E6EUE4_9BACT|nr:SGNH/GDSL hydrolase family protein [Telmatocola sphagniphila]QVL31285.1 SGNH/GDSL hydrolase family protein [Telmatocola sphagniphila]
MTRYMLLAMCLLSVPSVPWVAAEEVAVKTGDKIAFLGDSISEAGAGHPGGYVQLVISGLKANQIQVEMIPAGISGHKSNDMLARLERDVLSKKPTWMTLSCGVNDVWHGANGVPLPAYQKNITEIVDKAQAAGIKVMILTSTLIGEDAANANNKKLDQYNAFLHELAKEKKCLIADLNADMKAAIKPAPSGKKPIDRQLTSDGVHMGPLGDRLMAVGILKGFGLNSDQLKKANDYWLDVKDLARVDANRALTLRQYEKLSALAHSRGQSVSALVHDALLKAIDDLLATSP